MGEKRLTKEIAEQFLADKDSVDLEEFTDLDDDAAGMSLCHVTITSKAPFARIETGRARSR